jgi:hypothetical protein
MQLGRRARGARSGSPMEYALASHVRREAVRFIDELKRTQAG